MKKNILIPGILCALLFYSCGGSDTKSDSTSESPTVEKEKAQEFIMTPESYVKIRIDLRKLMMEEYWPQFKGKEYAEIKDIYEEYLVEKEAIYAKHGLDDPGEMSNYFRGHFSEIEEYQKTDPNYKEYPDYSEAKLAFGSLAIARANDLMDKGVME